MENGFYHIWQMGGIGRNRGIAGAGLLLILAAAPVAAAEGVVTDLRVGVHPDATRVVLDVSEQLSFSVFTLANPYRVVVDLPEVGWRLPARALPAGIGLLERIRYGLFEPGRSRLVLDVTGPARVTTAFLMKAPDQRGYRVVVDLAAVNAQAFLDGIKKPPRRISAVVSEPPGRETARAAAPPPVRAAPAPAPAVTPAAADVVADVVARAEAGVPVVESHVSRFPTPPRRPALAAAKARAVAAPPPPRKRIVALDPGHGGIDPGTVGVSGVYEKHVTLSMAREIGTALERTGRYTVVLTRDRDVFIRLRDRVTIAREAGAELFVSIHADAMPDSSTRGLSVYTLSEKASDREAELLAEKENKADLIAGKNLANETPEVAAILIDLAQRETMNESARFAAGLVNELKREARLLRNSHRFAGFAVLKAPDVPSVLLELGFLSNSQDERALRNRDHRARLAGSMVRAVDAFFARVEEASRR